MLKIYFFRGKKAKNKTLGCKLVEISLEDDFFHLFSEMKAIKEKIANISTSN